MIHQDEAVDIVRREQAGRTVWSDGAFESAHSGVASHDMECDNDGCQKHDDDDMFERRTH